MGLTCSNTHIFFGEPPAAPALSDLAGKFDEACDPLGYQRVEDRRPGESDLVAVAAPGWVTLSEPGGAGAITEDQRDTAQRLSNALQCPTLITAVYDSDDFAWLVFANGKQIDGFTTQDDLLPSPVKHLSNPKRAARWSQLFGKSFSTDDVKKLTRPLSVFAEDNLTALCRLLDVPSEHALLAFRADHADEIDEPSPTGPWCYERRLIGRSAADAHVTQTVSPDLEPSVGEHAAPKLMPLMPEEYSGCAFLLNAPAGLFRDPILQLSGPAIQQGLVRVVDATGMWFCGNENIMAGRAPWLQARIEDARSEDGNRVILAHFDGLACGEFEFPAQPLTHLTVSARWLAVECGQGQLQATFLPSSDATESLPLHPVFDVEVTKPAWVPLQLESYLRARESHPQLLAHARQISSAGVRQLNSPNVVSGVVILAEPTAQQFAFLADLLADWLTALAPGEDWHAQVAYEGQMNPQTFHVPRKKPKLQPAEIGTGRKWQRLLGKPDAIQSLFIERVADTSQPAVGGASIQRTFQDSDLNVAGTVHLAFWCRIDAHSPTNTRHAAEQRLAGLIDSAFTANGLQAWLAAWDWIPRFTMAEENNYTPYEEAYAINSKEPHDGGGYMDQTWCNRFLRGLAERMWFGASLLERIEQDRLATIGDFQPIGESSACFRLGADVPLNRLEQQLSPILPCSAVTL